MVAIETNKLVGKRCRYVLYKLHVNIAFLYSSRRIYLKILAYQSHKKISHSFLDCSVISDLPTLEPFDAYEKISFINFIRGCQLKAFFLHINQPIRGLYRYI